MNRIPVTIITGFLGSGKTTLLNNILDVNQHGNNKTRFAVIENEFAAAFGIENEILHEDKIEDVQNLYEFGMGCVCCSSSGELINALEEITIRNEQVPEEKKIQHVILETTGLADPTPIHELITLGANRKGNDSIVEHYYMNSIITLIDTKHFSQTLDSITSKEYKNELLAQVLTTDTIILNKIDLLAPEELAKLPELKAWVHLHNPNAKIIETSFSKIPADHNIFDTRQASISQKAIEEASKKHDPSVEQTMVLVPGFVDINKLQTFIKNTTRKGNVYRVKGVLALPSNPNIKFVIQGVNQDQLTITEHGPWQNDETKESRVTFIGKNVLKVCNELQDEFKTCLIK